MALTGHLSDLSLSELIEFFCNQRKTGQLKVLYPQGHGYFYLQAGSVVDARIGVLRGIDAVYFALTLPNAKFEFGAANGQVERTINQPWTQVVLEGLRRLDEGIEPTPAFPPEYETDVEETSSAPSFKELEQLRVPSFLSFINKESMTGRRFAIAGAVTMVVLLSVAAIGVPAGWYGRTEPAPVPVVTKPEEKAVEVPAPTEVQPEPVVAESVNNEDASLLAKRQRERERAKAREEATQQKPAAANSSAPVATSPAPVNVAAENAKPGPKRVSVTVTYDESGRVTQASGSDSTALRIARQKRFPAGKAGSATITIPIN
jgi:hypothetical protein